MNVPSARSFGAYDVTVTVIVALDQPLRMVTVAVPRVSAVKRPSPDIVAGLDSTR